MPDGHGRHLAAISWLLNWPRSQGEHCAAPSPEKWPAGHGSHELPATVEAVPAAHGVHVNVPPVPPVFLLPGGQPQLTPSIMGLRPAGHAPTRCKGAPMGSLPSLAVRVKWPKCGSDGRA